MIRAPVPNRALDVALRFQLSVQCSASEVRYFVVRSKSKRDQLTGCEGCDSTSEIARYQSLQTSALLETNDSILRSDRHESKEKHCDEQSERDNHLPGTDCTRITRKLDGRNNDIYEKDGQGKEVVRGNESPMTPVSLRALRHS
jgi:hypothetical protein